MTKTFLNTVLMAAMIALVPAQAVQANEPAYRCSLFKLPFNGSPGMRVVFGSGVDLTGMSGPNFYVECRLL